MSASGAVSVTFDRHHGPSVVIVVAACSCAHMGVGMPVALSVWIRPSRYDDPMGTIPKMPAAGPMTVAGEVNQPRSIPIVVSASIGADVDNRTRLVFGGDPVSTIPLVTTVGAVAMSAAHHHHARAVVIMVVTMARANVANGDRLVNRITIHRPLILNSNRNIFVAGKYPRHSQ